MKKINFGCGLSAYPDWVNYDASPTLRLQRMPGISLISKRLFKPIFPTIVNYGDIVKGLPEKDASCDYIYCSHVLEHLSLIDLRKALIEVRRILRPGGYFRGVLPDLHFSINQYLNDSDTNACSNFLTSTGLGVQRRAEDLNDFIRTALGNSRHLWMWDYKGLEVELLKTGFSKVRRASFNDSIQLEFSKIEDLDRWKNCLGFECTVGH
jgi:SAM-dependent methyltransferase